MTVHALTDTWNTQNLLDANGNTMNLQGTFEDQHGNTQQICQRLDTLWRDSGSVFQVNDFTIQIHFQYQAKIEIVSFRR